MVSHARRRRRTLAVLLVLFGCLWTRPAQAYDFYVNSQTIGQAYQTRAGDGTLLDRRRLTQYIRLGIFGLLDPQANDLLRRGSPEDSPSIGFVASFRYDSDFGITNDQRRQTPQLDPYVNGFSLLYAYFYGRNFFRGFLEWEIGRQFTIDLNDWYHFDGATVRFVLKPIFHSVEVFGGVEVKEDQPLGTGVFLLDGTSITPGDPFSNQLNAVSPAVGVALNTVGLRWFQSRLAYRRTWSVTSDPGVYGQGTYIRGTCLGSTGPGGSCAGQQIIAGQGQTVPAIANSGIQEEKLSYSATIFPYYPYTTIRVTGGFRYNFLLGQFDDIRAAADFAVTPRHTVGAEYFRVRPDFSGDSIFNVFSIQPTEDVHVRYTFKITQYWEVSARGTLRLFEYTYPPISAAQPTTGDLGRATLEGGGYAGFRYWNGNKILRGEFSWVQGQGGTRGQLDVSGRYPLWGERIRLDGRLSYVHWEDELRNPAPPGTQSFDALGNSFGIQAGGTWNFYRGMLIHVLLEENVNQIYASQFRILAMLDLTFWR
jgi:hypothetical protein